MYEDVEFLDECPNVNEMVASASKSSKNSKSANKKDASNDDIMDECLGILRTVVSSESKENVKKPTDRCQQFADYVASSLREMTRFNQSCAMTEVQNVLMKYDPSNDEVAD